MRSRSNPDNALELSPGLNAMPQLDRITFDPNVMGGKPCIRGMRVTVGTIVGLIASGATPEGRLPAS
jgi:uncharacterized protein (DUF433 family)